MKLLDNPFFVLGVTMRDDKRRIMDAAEEKSLISDEANIRNAAAVLNNPKKRLAAEIGWLLGLNPKQIEETISFLKQAPIKIWTLDSLPDLASANLLADALVQISDQLQQHEVVQWILKLANTHNNINSEHIITMLNEERSLAGFPSISDERNVNDELQERRKHYQKSIKNALGQLTAPLGVETVTRIIDNATENGHRQAPILIDDLVDIIYEVEVQEFLKNGAEDIFALAKDIRNLADSQGSQEHMNQLIAKLEKLIKNWDKVAQPIQVSAHSRGTSHTLSNQVFEEVRSLAIHLFNEHGLFDLSKKLTMLQQEVFAEVSKAVETLKGDVSVLDEIAEQKGEMEKYIEAWKKEITYETNIGVIFKKKLRISPDGVQWKKLNIPLEKITRIRWGGTVNSTGVTYTTFVGMQRGGITIKLTKIADFSEFTGRLWKAVGVRLLTEMLEGLRAGEQYEFMCKSNYVLINDYGVVLEKHKLFSKNELVHCEWQDLVIGSNDGTFRISKKDEREVKVELPYQEVDNVHVLEAALRVFWKTESTRLSDLLDKKTSQSNS